MMNDQTSLAFDRYCDQAARTHLRCLKIHGATMIDAGVQTKGSAAAGLALASLCMAQHAKISIVPEPEPTMPVDNAVFVQTDHPLHACLASQYAGWPVQTDDFFAMGSGPMRLLRGREPMLLALGLSDNADVAVGVLESEKLPTESAIATIASDCHVSVQNVKLAIAPSTSIAGTIQVVARSIETALHKMHELHFDVRNVVSATGIAPLPPMAKPGDTISGIGRTNDAILYGGRVTLWVDCEDESIEAIVSQIPSASSKDYGQPFAITFKRYGYDFYQVDPMLFSPAVITIHNLRSGRTHRSGCLEIELLRQSFLA